MVNNLIYPYCHEKCCFLVRYEFIPTVVIIYFKYQYQYQYFAYCMFVLVNDEFGTKIYVQIKW